MIKAHILLDRDFAIGETDPRLLDAPGLPYARLSLLRYPDAPEFLLLPKDSPEAHALGEGLRLAGAPDVIAYLEALQQRSAG